MNEIDEIKQIFAEKAASEEPVQVDIEDPIEEVIEDDVVTDDVIEDDTGEVVEESDDVEKYDTASLAEAIGWDTADVYDVEIQMPDGLPPTTIGAIKDDLRDALTAKAEMQTKMDGMSSEMNNYNDQTAVGQGVSQEMIQAFAKMDNIKQQYEQTNWAAIEAEDAGQAALLRQKFQEASQQGQAAINQAQNNMNQYKQQNLQRAAVKMFEIIPEWNNVETRKADQAAIRTMMMGEGYTEQAINGINDPIAMRMLRELHQLRAEKASAVGAVKKVRKAPKVLPGGGRRSTKKVSLVDKVKAGQTKVRGASAGGRRKAELDAVKQLFSKQG